LQEGDTDFRLVGTDANHYHLPLSLCERTYLIPLARQRSGYLAALREIAEREPIDAIVPTHPVEVRAVAELRDGGDLPFSVALPRTSILDIADDKARTQASLRGAGVAVPDTILIESQADLQRAFETFQSAEELRVWVRGSGAPGLGIGGAALPCTSVDVARAWIEHHKGWGKMAASPYLPGRNLTWMAIYRQGELLAAAARERLEYVLPHVSPSGITGAPAVSRTISEASLSQLGEAAVSALDDCPHGVYFVDLKGDRDGRALVTEINAGRCGTTVHFYARAGYNFPEALALMALGRPVAALPEPNQAVSPGQYWVRTLDCGPALVREDAFASYPRAGGRN
jgi:carbamoyl-phosphate synthase large subunit